MRIESKLGAVPNDILKVSNPTLNKQDKQDKQNKLDKQDTEFAKINESTSYSQLAHKPQQELTPDEKQWIKLIEKANKAINGANKTFEYTIHEETKQIMVKVIDNDTKKVLREIPSENILDMVARFWEMVGIIVDERR